MCRIVRIVFWGFSITLLPLLAAAQGSPVRLVSSIPIRAEIIHLSDLLPPDATAALLEQATQVQIARAPQLGSTRVLELHTIEQRLPPELLGSVEIPQQIAVHRIGWAIDPKRLDTAVRKFLEDKNSLAEAVVPNSLRWTQEIETAAESPELQVTSVQWNRVQSTFDFRVRCADQNVCGNFLVQAAASANAQSRIRAGRTSRGVEHPRPVLARPGQRATLVLENGSVRIIMPATCLDPGVLHQQVRAREIRGTHVFHAEVVGLNQLHATY